MSTELSLVLLLLPKCLKIILNTVIICLKEEPAGHQFSSSPNHIRQKQLPRLCHTRPPVCVLQNLKRGMSHWSCYAFWAFRRNMDLLLQTVYSLASQPVMCSDGSDAASDPRGCLPQSQLCCCSLAVSGRAITSCSSRGWQGSQPLLSTRDTPAPPQTPHSTTLQRAGATGTVCHALGEGESPTAILILPF